MAIEPECGDLDRFLASDNKRPFVLAQLLRLAEGGREKYLQYSAAAQPIAQALGITRVHAELLPQQKCDLVAELRRQTPAGQRVAMVGDGINDAPALAAAHVGVAFGRGAADLSAETAQVVVLDSGLAAIPDLLAFGRRTVRRGWTLRQPRRVAVRGAGGLPQQGL